MASYINTNYASLQAQYNLTQSQSGLNTSIQRLSSGLRINSAADDAAGLAISDRMTAQINGLNQAGRNANDGISLVQTADGALSSIAGDLQRMRQLAVQSSTGTLSSADRQSINRESQNLLSEINRVSSTTNFNGVNLLDGTFSNVNFQVGASSGQTVGMTLNSANTTSLGSYQFGTAPANPPGSSPSNIVSSTAFSATNTITITDSNTGTTGKLIGASVDTNTYLTGTTTTNTVGGFENSSAFAKAAAINAQSSSTGVTASASTGITGATPTGTGPLTAGDIYINGYSVGSALAGATTVQSGNNVATAINSISANTGVTASVDSSSGLISLNAADGRNINVAANVNGKAMLGLGNGAAFAGNSPISSEYNTSYGNLVLNSSVDFAITTTGTGTTAAGLNGLSQTFNGLSNIDLTTQSNASTALTTLDSAIQQVDTQRGNLGAIQNRFQLTVNNLSQGSINLQTSRSRIEDTDFAAQTAALSQSQILQQAGTAMLTQANTLPNSVLALLKG
jgi:flagellin